MIDTLRLSEPIDVRRLRQFLAVAEELHFTRAAKRLGIAQPPLSRAVRLLEASLGAPLFVRAGRVVSLTPAGEALRDGVRRALEEATRGVDAARRAHRGESGELRVGFSASAALSILPRLVRSHRDSFPGVRLTLVEKTTAGQIAALEAGALDVGIFRGPLRHGGIATRVLLRERLVAILPARHPLAASKRVDPARLAREPFVLFPRAVAPAFHDVVLRACGGPLRVAVEAAEWPTIVSLVAGGNGVSLGPESVRRLAWRDVAYRDAATPARAELLLGTRRDSRSPLVESFAATAARIA